jgi:hypothetical protein
MHLNFPTLANFLTTALATTAENLAIVINLWLYIDTVKIYRCIFVVSNGIPMDIDSSIINLAQCYTVS